ncbi:MAG TPA: ROK family protein [Thermoanaerobaculia bacterium]|nr:ROK family protein [Thermoanaerobaculia bacterium]
MPAVKRCWVGVDLGGTKILAGVFSSSGRWLGRRKRATPFAAGGRALVGAIAEAIDGAVADAGVPRSSIAAIGLGSPGPLDPERGMILRSPHLAVRRLPIGPAIAKAYSRPVVLDNDVHMALRGEWRMGAGKGLRNLVGLWIGTGVGGCVISGGRVLTGINRNAGELGHMIIDARRARAGTDRGSLEWEASKSGMTRWLKKEIRKGRTTALGRHAFRSGRLHSRALGDAYREGDRLAVEAVERSARYVGIAIANLFDALAPEVFILGGGVVEDIGAPYVRLARQAALAHAFSTELAKPRVVASILKDAAGALGAALAAREAAR